MMVCIESVSCDLYIAHVRCVFETVIEIFLLPLMY